MAKKNQIFSRVYNKIVLFLGSNLFLYIIIGLFVIQALWIALSFKFPMLYDEAYHFNLIKVVYAHQFSPLVIHQPNSYDVFGDLTRQGSTLYHYLLSFPFRIVQHFTSSLMGQVLALRVINIAFVSTGIYFYSNLLKKIGIRNLFINLGLLFYVMLPIVPYVGAHINYDNLLFMLVPLFLSIFVSAIKERSADWRDYAFFIILGCFASLVKYTFLPIFVFCFFVATTKLLKRKNSFSEILTSFKGASLKSKTLISVPLVCLGLLFIYFYIGNILLYRTPQPSCARTLSVQRCLSNNNGDRSFKLSATAAERKVSSPLGYSVQWSEQMEKFTDVTGISRDLQGKDAVFVGPLPLVYFATMSFSVVGAISLIFFWRRSLFIKEASIIAGAFVFYGLILFTQNMSDYYKYHAVVGVQPRYFLILAPFFIVLMVASLSKLLTNRVVSSIAVITFFLVYIQGAGIVTHIVRSDSSWYWQRPKIIKFNQKLKSVVDPLVVK